MAKKKPSLRLSHRHAFRFKLDDGQMITAWAKVVVARSRVELTLTADHLRKSMDGQGNTQKCVMAVCSREHGDAFPHPFHYVDWTYKRAYFVTKVKNGMPVECVVYTHHDEVAPKYDTKPGMRALLKQLDGGSKTINLYPPKFYAKPAGRPKGKNTGALKRPFQPRAANLRFMRMSLGGASAA